MADDPFADPFDADDPFAEDPWSRRAPAERSRRRGGAEDLDAFAADPYADPFASPRGGDAEAVTAEQPAVRGGAERPSDVVGEGRGWRTRDRRDRTDRPAAGDPTASVRIIPDDTREPALRLGGDETGQLPHWSAVPPSGSARQPGSGRPAASGRQGGRLFDEADDDLAAWQSFSSGPVWRDESGGGSGADDLDELDDLRSRLSSGVRVLDEGDDTGAHPLDAPEFLPPVAISTAPRSGGGTATGRTGQHAATPEDPFIATRGTGGRDMGRATAIGVALAAVAVAAFFLGQQATLVLVVAVLGGCAIDYFGRAREQGWGPATLIGIVAVAGAPIAAYHEGEGGLLVVMAVAVVGTLVWYVVVDRESSTLQGAGTTLVGIAWIGGLGGFAGILCALPRAEGLALLVAAAVAVVAVDVVGLLAGSAFGRTALAPSVSPSKTWEGTIAGVVASTVATTVLIGSVPGMSPLDVRWQHPFQIGLAAGIAAVFGGLVASALKRDLGVKDWGTLLPGHGGVLDRFDGFLFAVPTTYFLARLLNIAGL